MLEDFTPVSSSVKNLTGGGSGEMFDGVTADELDYNGTRTNYNSFLGYSGVTKLPDCHYEKAENVGDFAYNSAIESVSGVQLGSSDVTMGKGSTNYAYIFSSCANLKEIVDFESYTDGADYFCYNCKSLTTVKNVSFPKATSALRMFSSTKLVNIDSINMPAVTDLSYFCSSSGMQSIPKGILDVLPSVNSASSFMDSCDLGDIGDITFGVAAAGSGTSIFCFNPMETVEALRFPNITAIPTMLLAYCHKLRTVGLITVGDGVASHSSELTLFSGCTALKSFSICDIQGTSTSLQKITCNASNYLTVETLEGLINAILAKDSGGYSLRIGSTNLAKLSDDIIATATEKDIAIS